MYSSEFREVVPDLIRQFRGFLRLLWQLTEGDFKTLVLPSVVFGFCTGIQQICAPSEAANILDLCLRRLPLVVVFNWSNVFIFDLENQRMPEAILEDAVNKPWRPIPSGMITVAQAKVLVLVAAPLVFLVNFAIGVWHETALLYILTWTYNDIGGGDGIYRNPIVSLAFALFNAGSVRTLLGPDLSISRYTYFWIALVSCIVLTTIHISDLRDQEGDAARGRKTIPLLFSDSMARRTIASFVLLWSIIGPFCWKTGWLSIVPIGAGAFIAWRVLYNLGPEYDDKTWKLWALWMVTLYLLPMLQLLQQRNRPAGLGR